MEYVKFGKTGLDVSRLCIGCMTYGIPDRGSHPWTLEEEKSRPLIKQAVELGINFFDTANVYSDGTSEEILGRALKEYTRREDVVIATKVNGRMRPGPNGAGLSRHHHPVGCRRADGRAKWGYHSGCRWLRLGLVPRSGWRLPPIWSRAVSGWVLWGAYRGLLLQRRLCL